MPTPDAAHSGSDDASTGHGPNPTAANRSLERLGPELLGRIRDARSLPSPPAVAARLIDLAQRPDTGLTELTETLRSDAALTARVLRLANSALHRRHQRCETLHQAVVMLGIDAVITAALSVSLLSDRERVSGRHSLVRQHWTRSVRAAAAAQVLARHCGGVAPGDAFLGGLLQDIGVLVLLRLDPETYDALPFPLARHQDLLRSETERLGVDHAAVGTLLLETWNLPPRIVEAVEISHTGGPVAQRLGNVVALGGLVADWLEGATETLPAIVGTAEELIGLDADELARALDELATVLPDLTHLFETDPPPSDALTEMAAEVLVARELRRRVGLDRPLDPADGLTDVTQQLIAASRVDAVTGLATRAQLDLVLEREFELARELEHDLTVLFIDLDDFKTINDRYGHRAGDAALRIAAERTARCVRDQDTVGRYGGDEFVIVLPGADAAGAERVVARVMRSFTDAPVRLPAGVLHDLGISIGSASLDRMPTASAAAELVHAADMDLLEIKRRRASVA